MMTTNKVIALAGNPNVGKSTIFNKLTGLNQHTGNWPGKTVESAQGNYVFNGESYTLVDIPGTYSLLAHSAEEEIARNFICFGDSLNMADGVIVVCDATCFERNLNLVLQTIEITPNVVVCINLIDEAKKKKIHIDFKKLEENLGVPVVATNATRGEGLHILKSKISNIKPLKDISLATIEYAEPIEDAISILKPALLDKCKNLNPRWLAIRLIENDISFIRDLESYLDNLITRDNSVLKAMDEAIKLLKNHGISSDNFEDSLVLSIISKAEDICKKCISFENPHYNLRDRKIDKILTSKLTGIPVMLLLLAFIFWLTIVGSNYPSRWLSNYFFFLLEKLSAFMNYMHVPKLLNDILISGIFRTVAWVVSVMLPPMAIFFPLFTLLEDLGYLPRIAFNLDHSFKKCCACGKQALTMCMGFGCNAVGVTGCRIIDSERERLIAIITNNFVPCNGRFPTLIALITMFFVVNISSPWQSLTSSLFLTLVILLGVLMTFLVSRILSHTVLKGLPSSFALELPPYRSPQIFKTIIRSILDRTLLVLGRAISVAAPCGLIIWLMANVKIYDMSILSYCSNFLDPFARLIGLDGVILMAFVLGFPANEIVFPIMIMAYLSQGSILELDSLENLRELLINNGWTWVTAVCVMLFSLMHWPCSTTCLTIKNETKSLKWTVISIIVPTVAGMTICLLFNSIVQLIRLI